MVMMISYFWYSCKNGMNSMKPEIQKKNEKNNEK